MDWPADVDPADLRQPDSRSCGATCVVAARMLLEPSCRPGTRREVAAEILRAHARLTSPSSARGRVQLPWPPALGTPPWAVASALAGLTGDAVRTMPARSRADDAWAWLRPSDHRPVAVYVGNAWLPRHVVLALATAGDDVRLFDPAAGRLLTRGRDAWTAGRFDVAGWSHVWAVV